MAGKRFSGNIFIFHAFDIGDDINFEKVKKERIVPCAAAPSKYFKNYHIPLALNLPEKLKGSHCSSIKLHSFGVITLRYAIPFHSTLEEVRTQLDHIDRTYNQQSIRDAEKVFELIKHTVKQARFFHLRKSYVLIQVNSEPSMSDIINLKKEYGSTIASMLRFETETLSEFQKNEILESAFGYYRGDLIIIDTEAAFMYDDEYEEVLDLFEFGNLQQLELHYFDRLLDKQLNQVYEREVKSPPLSAYLPFIGMANDPIGDLGKLKVDISVITERLENSIKLIGEAYYSDLYALLIKKLDLANWKESINRKLGIIEAMGTVYQHKIDSIRGDILSVAVIVLVFGEFLLGFLNLMKH